jgi:hypothetical protein
VTYTNPAPLNERTYSNTMNAAVKRCNCGTPNVFWRPCWSSRKPTRPLPLLQRFVRGGISGRPDAADRAEGLWREMLENQVIDAQTVARNAGESSESNSDVALVARFIASTGTILMYLYLKDSCNYLLYLQSNINTHDSQYTRNRSHPAVEK